MPNKNDIAKTLVFIALATFMVGSIAATVIEEAAYASMRTGKPPCGFELPNDRLLVAPGLCRDVVIEEEQQQIEK